MKEVPQKDSLRKVLRVDDTLGVRIPDSAVERQLSIELGSPITTAAVRDDSGHIIQKFDDAVDILKKRLESRPKDIWLATIKSPRFQYSDHSTVASVQPKIVGAPYQVLIYRPGAVEPEALEDTIRKLTFSDIEEWT